MKLKFLMSLILATIFIGCSSDDKFYYENESLASEEGSALKVADDTIIYNNIDFDRYFTTINNVVSSNEELFEKVASGNYTEEEVPEIEEELEIILDPILLESLSVFNAVGISSQEIEDEIGTTQDPAIVFAGFGSVIAHYSKVPPKDEN